MSKEKAVKTLIVFLSILFGYNFGKEKANLVREKRPKPQIMQSLADRSGNNEKSLNRILCWILTNPRNHATKARGVRDTWGKSCQKLIFMSTREDPELGAIDLGTREGRNMLWEKTRAALKYIYKNHLNDYDWFLKADDDSFVILENILNLVKDYKPTDPIYFGSKRRFWVKSGWCSGAGHVMSREALTRLMERGFADKTGKYCPILTSYHEDLYMGRCMQHSVVSVGDARDPLNKTRFHPYSIRDMMVGSRRAKKAYKWSMAFKNSFGIKGMSQTAILWHYVRDHYPTEYLTKRLKVHGLSNEVHYPEDLRQEKIEQNYELIKNQHLYALRLEKLRG